MYPPRFILGCLDNKTPFGELKFLGIADIECLWEEFYDNPSVFPKKSSELQEWWEHPLAWLGYFWEESREESREMPRG